MIFSDFIEFFCNSLIVQIKFKRLSATKFKSVNATKNSNVTDFVKLNILVVFSFERK